MRSVVVAPLPGPAGASGGLAGLRERVGVLGGEFSAGPEPWDLADWGTTRAGAGTA